jgi:hypothetical protein
MPVRVTASCQTYHDFMNGLHEFADFQPGCAGCLSGTQLWGNRGQVLRAAQKNLNEYRVIWRYFYPDLLNYYTLDFAQRVLFTPSANLFKTDPIMAQFHLFPGKQRGYEMATEGKSTLLKDIGKTIMLLAGVFFVVWVVVFVALSISTNNI